MVNNRFVTNDDPEVQQANHNPIFGYEDSPLLTLEETLEEIPNLNIMDHVKTAKKKYNRHSDLLTRDESAAVYLYSMSSSFYSCLNNVLRTEDREKLKPWFPFLKLFITALEKLPLVKKTVWRGVNFNDTLTFLGDDEHIWWSVNSCSKSIRAVQPFIDNGGTLYAIEALDGRDISEYSANPDEQEVILMPGTHVRRKSESLNFENRYFTLHLEQINPSKKSNYLFKFIKQRYQQNSRIERILNPAKSFPIHQSYINLAIVTTKEQDEKEKQLRDVQYEDAIMNTFEEIYGMKTTIDIQDIFNTCPKKQKQILVFGRAGIGKSTFCRYVAYKWATGAFWEEYELLALIPLRCLTTDRYPPLQDGHRYSLVDLVKKEVLSMTLSEKEDYLLKTHFDTNKTLWILDGYDEIVQNLPTYLEYLLEQLLKTPHHILTSRPYLNTLSYDVKMEITGFKDENIEEYVEQFFDQMENEFDNVTIKSQALLKYLKINRSIWGVAHIPVNLEVICSIWSNEDSFETKDLTITSLYNIMTEWLCRRYLIRTSKNILQLPGYEIEHCCQKELTFLESLAFHAMENNTIIIRPLLLKKASEEAKVSFQDCPHVLNLGILKSFNQKGIGTQIEADKDYYFIHLSFQEYFAARYVMHALGKPSNKQAIEFIKYQKYNQRFTLVFTFMSGLLVNDDFESCFNIFWNTIMSEPMDLVGIRHIQLIIICLEAMSTKSSSPGYDKLLARVTEYIQYSFYHENKIIRKHLSQSLQRTPLLMCTSKIIHMLSNLLQSDQMKIKSEVLLFISELKISNPRTQLIQSIIDVIQDTNTDVRIKACLALGSMGEKAETIEVISKLMIALGDEVAHVRTGASYALGMISEKTVSNSVIDKLVHALTDENESVRASASYTLEKLCVKTVTNETITELVNALGHDNKFVRARVSYFFGNIAEEVATKEIISKLMSALKDDNENIKAGLVYILGKMGKKTATDDVINVLLNMLADENECIRSNVCEALGNIGEKAARNEVISKLENALRDKSGSVRRSACEGLEHLGEKVEMNKLIRKLITTLDSKDMNERRNACEALGYLNEKTLVNEVTRKLIKALRDKNDLVRISACKALGMKCAKEATNEIIIELANAVEDTNEKVRVSACESLEMIDEKALTDEVIKKLGNALEDNSKTVRAGVLFILGKMGKRIVNQEVIDKVVNALKDQETIVRNSACYTLADFGDIKMTNKLINGLVTALDDVQEDVRAGACKALGKISDKIVTNQVISKLLNATGDKNGYVRFHVCQALRNMNEKKSNE